MLPLSNSGVRSYPDIEELQEAATELGSARERFMEAVQRVPEPAVEEIEITAAELLQRAGSLSRRLRCGLSALMATYAAIWSHAHRSAHSLEDLDEPDALDALDDHLDVEDDFITGDSRIESLDRLTEKIEGLIAHSGTISEGRSQDGRVIAKFNNDMRLIDLNLDPHSLNDPAYRASVVEAVNAGLEPVLGRRQGVAFAWMPEPEACGEAPEVVDETNDAALQIYDAMLEADEVQRNLTRLLPRSGDLPRVVERAKLIEEECQSAEERLDGHLASLDDCRAQLAEKARLADITPEDLTSFASLEEVFVEMELDEHFEVEPLPGLDIGPEVRILVETVAEELRRQDEERRSLRTWQGIAKRLRSQVAAVEQRSFEGRSPDGVVTARAMGTVLLAELEVAQDHPAEAASTQQSVIDAVNAAIREASHRRTCSMLIAGE